ncbi:MAG: hypothetical protein QME81_01330 [bacterium]|nr:hypothetical protein [bacterium]
MDIVELMKDDRLRDGRVKKTREFILENCSIESIYKEEIDLYRGLLKSGAKD